MSIASTNVLKVGSYSMPGLMALAPMAGVTNLPFRVTCQDFGCGLAFTEMISTEGLLREHHRTLDMVRSFDSEKGHLGIQLFGDDPDRLADGAKWVQDYTPASVVNVNMGCPVPKVTKRNGGAALLKNPELIGRIVSSLKRVSRLPVTIKIRAGWDHDSMNYLEVLRIAEASGVDALICHPRTRAQGYSGNADWTIIKELVDHARIPIFGNGDLFTAEDACRIVRETGCAGVMIARGANGNPWIFAAERFLRSNSVSQHEIDQTKPKLVQDVGQVVIRHLQLALEIFGSHRAHLIMKRHLAWYSKWLNQGKKEYRVEVMRAQSYEDLYSLCLRQFRMNETPEPVYEWWKAQLWEEDSDSECEPNAESILRA